MTVSDNKKENDNGESANKAKHNNRKNYKKIIKIIKKQQNKQKKGKKNLWNVCNRDVCNKLLLTHNIKNRYCFFIFLIKKCKDKIKTSHIRLKL